MDLNRIYTGDCIEIMQTLPSESVNCCITSPPYYNLRDYGMEDQIGLEHTPEEYISKLVRVFHEVQRVLRQDGTLWLVIGDSYAGSNKGRSRTSINYNKGNKGTQDNANLQYGYTSFNIKNKELIGIPWMLAFALRNDGWHLRQDIVWYKPNAMPESVKDRCTRSHEYVFLLTKSCKYYYDNEAIKEPAVTADRNSPRGSKGATTPNSGRRKQNEYGNRTYTGFNERYFSQDSFPLMRNKRDVWSISTRGCKDSHFATFPPQIVEPCLLAGCPKEGVVLDPFIGSGTTAAVAIKNGRNYVGIDINPDYVKLAKTRIKNANERSL